MSHIASGMAISVK